jgi:epoxide hydrolase
VPAPVQLGRLWRRPGQPRLAAGQHPVEQQAQAAPPQLPGAPGVRDADRRAGFEHVTQLFSFPSGDPAEFEGLSETDMTALQHLQWFYDNKFSFNVLHSQQPQTPAFALADSPVGLLAWNAQLFGESLDRDFILANVAIYWLTGTSGSAIRFYYEDAHAGERPGGPTTVPTGLAMFAGDFQSIRRFADRDHANIVSWNAYGSATAAAGQRDAAGHYAAHEATDVLVNDIRAFFREVA